MDEHEVGQPLAPGDRYYDTKPVTCFRCETTMSHVATEWRGRTRVELHGCGGCGKDTFLRIPPQGLGYAPNGLMECFDRLALKLRLEHCCSSEAERAEALGWYEVIKHGPSGEPVLDAKCKLYGWTDGESGPYRATGLSYDEARAIRNRLRQEAADDGAA
jgi:hypothetical protein